MPFSPSTHFCGRAKLAFISETDPETMTRKTNKEAETAFRKKIGQRISALRSYRKKTQTQVGDYIGIGQDGFAKWETGKVWPNELLMMAVCAYLEADFNYFYMGKFSCFDPQTAADLAASHPEITRSDAYLRLPSPDTSS